MQSCRDRQGRQGPIENILAILFLQQPMFQELAGWKSETMVRRYAHLSVKHLQPYADQLIMPDTAPNPAKSLEVGDTFEHKTGHNRKRPRLELVVSN